VNRGEYFGILASQGWGAISYLGQAGEKFLLLRASKMLHNTTKRKKKYIKRFLSKKVCKHINNEFIILSKKNVLAQ